MWMLRGSILPGHLRGDRLGLGDLLGLEAIALEHVHEVHVAADVELVGPVDGDAAVLEQPGQHAVGDGGAHLALDVVADDRHTGVRELLGPLRRAGDEHGKRVDEGDLRVDGALRVVLRGLLRADGQVADQDVDLVLQEAGDDVHRLLVGLGHHLAVVLAQAVEGVAAGHGHARRGHVADLDGVVLAGHDRVRRDPGRPSWHRRRTRPRTRCRGRGSRRTGRA